MLKLLVDLAEGCIAHLLCSSLELSDLPIVVVLGLDPSLSLEFGDDVLLLTAKVRGKLIELASSSMRLNSNDLDSLCNYHSLLLIVWIQDSL